MTNTRRCNIFGTKMQVINAFEQCFFQSLTLLSETLLSLKLPLLAACPYQIIITIFHISQKYLHSWFSLSNFEKNWTDHGYLFLMSNSRKPCLKWYLGTSIQEWASIFIILRYIIFHIWHDTVNIQTVLQAPMSIYRREYYIFHVYFKNQS